MPLKSSLNKFTYESPDGLKYSFTGRILEHKGIGMRSIKFIEDFGPQQDGATVRDWRVNPRTISLQIFLQGDECCDTRGEQLAELINIIRPNRGTTRNDNGWLRFLNDSQELMEIPVFISVGPSGDYEYNGDVGKWQVSDAVQFYAPDPIWREFEKVSQIVEFDNQATCLGECLGSTFCINPTTFAAFEITYNGTWDGDQIDIILSGPIREPFIENVTTGKRISLDYDIAAGEIVTISIRPEFVTVTSSLNGNLIGSITSISDLVDFVLKTESTTTPDGINNIEVFFVGGKIESSITIEYWTRHISAFGKPQCVV